MCFQESHCRQGPPERSGDDEIESVGLRRFTQFVKPQLEQFTDGRERVFGILPLGGQLQFRPLGCTECQERQNAATIDLLGTFVDQNRGIKTIRTSDDQVSRPCVQPLRVDDSNGSLDRRVRVRRRFIHVFTRGRRVMAGF